MPRSNIIPGESKKYTRLMSHNTASIVSILKTGLGLDRQDFELDYGTLKIHFTSLLIGILKHKPAEIGQKMGYQIQWKTLQCKVCVYSYFYDVYLYFYWF